MRSMGIFLDEVHFPLGFQQQNAFNLDESKLLENYGLTMLRLQEGDLLPATADEHFFLAELDGEFELTSDFARCWRKYNHKITHPHSLRNTTHKRSSKQPSRDYFVDEISTIEDIDSTYDELDLDS
ncbi:DUF413 domain-containing protein [Moritella viscosa]|uniref:Macrodomain Ori protein n=2 Tax=Moritella viscosa TaxID=80854 RepID=A0ABY1HBK0_9GAMM|nr:DUF413 domain-containing protein [Moritella viscosa]CED59543.1 putative uncharacterized protein [Moritella viscosa]SGY86847.1 Putative uncharacterized protein [Moritella viscosa]SHO01158.1 Putative uncharacterized protein [Moritella viscosa]SHO01439.1 Putative uncharacterized protein [Moritella viscosa]SHO02085.1 Putative uncharacterized protein [Moritella viscosa]